MAYDLEEQEQLESLKAWWKQYGNTVTWALIVALLAFAGWSGWNYWQRKQAGDAAVLYEQVTKAAEARDAERVKRAATDLEDKFGRTAYGPMSALTAAKVLYDAGDLAGAKTQLQWAIDHGGDDYAPLARVRLAGADLDDYAADLPALFITSQVILEPGSELKVTVERASGSKCERCWKYSGKVGEDAAYPTVCDSCASALHQMLGGSH